MHQRRADSRSEWNFVFGWVGVDVFGKQVELLVVGIGNDEWDHLGLVSVPNSSGQALEDVVTGQLETIPGRIALSWCLPFAVLSQFLNVLKLVTTDELRSASSHRAELCSRH